MQIDECFSQKRQIWCRAFKHEASDGFLEHAELCKRDDLRANVRSHQAEVLKMPDSASQRAQCPVVATHGGVTLFETRVDCRSVAKHNPRCLAIVREQLEPAAESSHRVSLWHPFRCGGISSISLELPLDSCVEAIDNRPKQLFLAFEDR